MKIKFDKKIFPIDFKSKDALFYYIPYGLLALWVVFSILSVFSIHYKILFRGFVLFSILIRLGVAGAGAKLLYDVFIVQVKNKQTYYLLKTFTGYGIVITYVFYSLPRIVGEFDNSVSPLYSAINYCVVIFITLFPVLLFLFLGLEKTKLISKCFTPKDLEYEKKMKKDKKFKKGEIAKIRKKRSFLANLWYEWIDDILQAIITVMIIQQILFQMYMIPSESMVPTFLIKDRVVVNKLVYGPHIPLTEWKLPAFSKPKIGDIVVFKNPAVDDPESEVHYKNVFTRVFHPFIFLLTLSMVDIDKKPGGSPKEWFIVKRLIAGEGEKICVLNDKVYKKKKNSKWQLMSLIPKEKEYGQADLFLKDNPEMHAPNITPELRKILNDARDIVNKEDDTGLNEELARLKSDFLLELDGVDLNEFIAHVSEHLESNRPRVNKNKTDLLELFKKCLHFNDQGINLPKSVALASQKQLPGALRKYNYNILYQNIEELRDYMAKYSVDSTYFNRNIVTSLSIDKSASPYRKFMKKYNAVYKKYRIKLFITLLQMYKENSSLETILVNEDHYAITAISPLIEVLYALVIYTDGIHFEEPQNFRYSWITFPLSNFSDFPAESDSYLPEDSYFMMGDNRYNSHDSRFNRPFLKAEYLDPSDKTEFAKVVGVWWDPRIIHMHYILGKASAIYYPFDRFGLLK